MNRFVLIRVMMAFLPVMGLGLAGVPTAMAQHAPDRTGRAAIYSTDRRFMVSGMTSAENMVLARKLTALAEKIEAKTGMPLPMRKGQILGVMVQSASAPDSRILKMQGWDDGRFYQRLVVPGAIRLDEEDLMEGACWLLLNRYAAEYTPAAQRAGMGATMPDWISAGLVQNTQAALRSRNRDWISRELGEDRTLSLAEVLKQEQLPPGRWREKAYAAAAVEFLFPDGDLNAWARLFKAVGSRQALGPRWFRKNWPALQADQPERVWRGYLETYTRTRTLEAWSDRGLQVEQKLLQTLTFKPREWANGIPDDVPPDLFARDLIDYRQQEWISPLAAALSLQVQSLKLGAPPLLQDVLASYTAFFEQLVTPPLKKRSWWQRARKNPGKIRPPDDATWQVALNQLWQRAERAHQRFLETHQTRRRYVDSFDQAAPGEFDESPSAVTDQPRTRLQQYVDDVEERRSREAF